MKKADVLQLTMVLIGIVLGFTSLQYLFSSLYIIFTWIFSGGYGGESYFAPGISVFAVIGLQVLCCWLLITRSGKLAAWFYKRAELGTGFKIITNPNQLLHILLVAMGIYLLLSNLSPLLTGIFESFKKRASGGITDAYEDERPVAWTKPILDILLPLLLLILAKPVAGYFSKNIGEEPISIEESMDASAPETNED